MSGSNGDMLRTLKDQLSNLKESKENLIREHRRWEETPNDAHHLVQASEIGLDAIIRAETAIRMGIGAASLAFDVPLAVRLHQHAEKQYKECVKSAMALMVTARLSSTPAKDDSGVQRVADRLAEAEMWERVLQTFRVLAATDSDQ